MVDYHYDDNISQDLKRKKRVKYLLIASLVTIFGLIAYVLIDSLRTKTEVTESSPTQTLGSVAEQQVFDETTYRFTTDPSWQRVVSRDTAFTAFRYQSVEDDLIKRDLTVYVNTIPEDFPLTHVLPVEIVNAKIIPLEISPKCSSLQENQDNKQDISLTWAGVSYICDPDLNAYVIGTSHNQTGYSLNMTGPTTNNKYFFVFRDLESVPNLETFSRLLKTFVFK